MSAARIAAIEKKLADVEERHAEAIARLSLMFQRVLVIQTIALNSTENDLTRGCVAVDNLVPAAAQDVFEEWEGGDNKAQLRELDRLASLANRKQRSTPKVAKAEEAGA